MKTRQSAEKLPANSHVSRRQSFSLAKPSEWENNLLLQNSFKEYLDRQIGSAFDKTQLNSNLNNSQYKGPLCQIEKKIFNIVHKRIIERQPNQQAYHPLNKITDILDHNTVLSKMLNDKIDQFNRLKPCKQDIEIQCNLITGIEIQPPAHIQIAKAKDLRSVVQDGLALQVNKSTFKHFDKSFYSECSKNSSSEENISVKKNVKFTTETDNIVKLK